MKTKILISVRGGLVDFVCSTEEVEICIVDHDNLATGEEEPFALEDSDFGSQDQVMTPQEINKYLNQINCEYFFNK